MNYWIEESIKIANARGYLGKLEKIYRVEWPGTRELVKEKEEEIRTAYKQMNPRMLVEVLLDVKKFPIDDPYVSFLRHTQSKLGYNVKTANRIGKQLLREDVEDIIDMCCQPKKVSRTYGESFRKWWDKRPYMRLKQSDFEKIAIRNVVAVYEGSSKDWKRFCNVKLRCGLKKDPDFLAKKNKKHIIGEAKLLTGFGGTQNGAFDEATEFALKRKGKATRIAVLDGVLWLDTKCRQSRNIREYKGIALSALLLEDYLKKL